MNTHLISIIIPAYNCEKYIARCIDSILDQTYNNIEIILINDGSTDYTDEICEIYAKKDSRIIYIKQDNHGVAYTRKKGIQQATGKYIGFVDADDYIDEDMYEQMCRKMNETGVELVTSGYYLQGEKTFDAFPVGEYRTKKERERVYGEMIIYSDGRRGISTTLWNKLFLTRKLQTVLCKTSDNLFIGEDAEILYKYLLNCKSIYISNICSYHYEFNSNSIMHSTNENYLYNVNSLYLSLKQEFESSKYRNLLVPQLDRWIWDMVKWTPRFMDFQITRPICYLNPFDNLLNVDKLILYGAGSVGKDYFMLYQKKAKKPLLWVDISWKSFQKEGLQVQPIDKIEQVDYEYILIAVKDEKKANEIRACLKGKGVCSSKILWQEPIQLD